MMNWDELWRFETARFAVVLEVQECRDDPSDQLDDEGVAMIERGDAVWFDARVRVLNLGDESELASDYLGCCHYSDFEDFYTAHRGPDPLDRNSTIFRAKHGDNACVCHYFPSMVLQAVAQARVAISNQE